MADGINGAVLKTSQVAELVECVKLVAERTDRLWERDGEQYVRDAMRYAPDDNDPEVMRAQDIGDLDFLQKLREHFADVAEILLGSHDVHHASTAIATLLGMDEVDVTVRLTHVNLFALTHAPAEAGAQRLADLRRTR